MFLVHGPVQRVYIPKETRNPKYRFSTFAFVQFGNENGLRRAVENLNGATIDGRRITVGVARYNESRAWVERNNKDLKKDACPITADISNPKEPDDVLRSLRDDRSYKDALMSNRRSRSVLEVKDMAADAQNRGKVRKNIMQMQISSESSSWVKRSLTGIIKHSFELELVHNALVNEGYDVQIVRWGYVWNSCVIIFKSVEEMSDAWMKKKEDLQFWFDRLEPLLNEDGRWGRVIDILDDTKHREDLTKARLLIRVASPFDVPDQITIGAYGRSFKVTMKIGSANDETIFFSINPPVVSFDEGRFGAFVTENEGDRIWSILLDQKKKTVREWTVGWNRAQLSGLVELVGIIGLGLRDSKMTADGSEAQSEEDEFSGPNSMRIIPAGPKIKIDKFGKMVQDHDLAKSSFYSREDVGRTVSLPLTGILPCNQKRPPVIAPPSSTASPSSPNHHSHHDKVRTIFISGLPTDVKERELQNLLRWLPDTLQEMVFDDKLKSLLHIEMAKKNLVVKKGMGIDSVAVDIYSCHPVPPVLPVPNPALGAPPSIHVHDKSGCYVEKSTAVAVQDGSGESTTKDCINDKSGCFTLFIDNLPEKIHWKSKIGVSFAKFKPRHSYWRKSSTSILRKSGMEDVSSKNHYKVEGVIDEEKLQVLSNCLVGWCKDFVKIGHLARQMQSKGLTGFTLMRAAGNAILMIFEDNASLRSVKNDKSKILAEWFSIVEAWSESLVMECRRVWLVCEGVPFHAWNWNTFKNIADKWGLLLAIDESCQSPSSFDRAKIQVLTKADARIDSMVELKVGDNFFKVMVHEIEPSFKPNSWAPEEYKSH
ncbi:receptor-like protein kinase-like [Hibiscus syriacus]|uniref:Receptor-like protein kinase-like n=1 Tax=Hibiscus syriacus TaxID=106335 RepID=A0A6A2ZJH7_HIBSY|nr:receptor-like protein kinase-like [Hibiscus syriacus]